MAEVTGIAWCDHTFNPWIGCQKVSPACDHCYAETQDVRFHGGVHWGPGAPRRRTTDAYWRAPLLWHRKAKAAGVRRRVFCASSADVFDNAVPETWRQDLWALIAATPALDWLLLTKRPQNILKMLPANWGGGWPSVWLGTSVENEVERRRRVPVLLTVGTTCWTGRCTTNGRRAIRAEPPLSRLAHITRMFSTRRRPTIMLWMTSYYGSIRRSRPR
jgi:protein gp37